MRTVVTNKSSGRLAIALLIACLIGQLSTNAMVAQRAILISTSAAPGHTDNPGNRPVKGAVLVKNTNSTAAASRPDTVAQKPQKVESKNTISRCWKRLMDNVREVRHAHRKK